MNPFHLSVYGSSDNLSAKTRDDSLRRDSVLWADLLPNLPSFTVRVGFELGTSSSQTMLLAFFKKPRSGVCYFGPDGRNPERAPAGRPPTGRSIVNYLPVQ
jgi:hypothetical protein